VAGGCNGWSEVAIVLYGELAAVVGPLDGDVAFENTGTLSLSAGARNQFYPPFGMLGFAAR